MQLQVPNFHNTVYKPEGKPKAAVLILHGMKEHSGRYAGFAQYLRNQSYLVLTYDQPGHGQTPKTKEDLGYISSTHPAQHLVKAAKEMSEFLIGQYPGLPIFLLGHSMGSFVARVLLKSSFSLFKGVVLIGSGDSNLLARLAIFPLWLLNIFVPKKRSTWFNEFFTSINNKRFKKEVPYDGTNWLSKSKENRKAFLSDEYCMIEFTFNAFFALLTLHVEATRSNWSDTLPRNFPILFLSGQEDPIGEYGKGINKTIHSLERSGFKNVTSYIYPSLRHEILNEKENKKVYKDITNWLNKNQ